MTLKNKISQLAKRFSLRNANERSGSIKKSRKNYQITFLGDELEKRQLLALYGYNSSTGLLIIQTNTTDEQISIVSSSNNGDYSITTNIGWNNNASIRTLNVIQPIYLTSIQVNDNAGTIANSSNLVLLPVTLSAT